MKPIDELYWMYFVTINQLDFANQKEVKIKISDVDELLAAHLAACSLESNPLDWEIEYAPQIVQFQDRFLEICMSQISVKGKAVFPKFSCLQIRPQKRFQMSSDNGVP